MNLRRPSKARRSAASTARQTESMQEKIARFTNEFMVRSDETGSESLTELKIPGDRTRLRPRAGMRKDQASSSPAAH